LLVYCCHYLDVLLFKNHQDYKEEDSEQQQVEKSKCP
jgi:hypothetical protein